MDEDRWQAIYRKEAGVLGEIGLVWARAELARVEVRLPSSLARRAVEAWDREYDVGPGGPESFEQRVLRHRAGTLALIGLAVRERGRTEGDEIVVDLSPDLIGVAVDAADDLP